jgi:hypothetical protein
VTWLFWDWLRDVAGVIRAWRVAQLSACAWLKTLIFITKSKYERSGSFLREYRSPRLPVRLLAEHAAEPRAFTPPPSFHPPHSMALSITAAALGLAAALAERALAVSSRQTKMVYTSLIAEPRASVGELGFLLRDLIAEPRASMGELGFLLRDAVVRRCGGQAVGAARESELAARLEAYTALKRPSYAESAHSAHASDASSSSLVTIPALPIAMGEDDEPVQDEPVPVPGCAAAFRASTLMCIASATHRRVD